MTGAAWNNWHVNAVLERTRRSPVERALIWSTVTSSTAKGLQFAVSALFFTTVVGLSPAAVGLGLTIAGGAGMAAAFAAGYLCERFGAHRLLLATTITQGLALALYCFAHTAWAFCLVACVAVGAQGAQRTAQTTLLARTFTGTGRVEVRARLRVATNVFVGAGSAVAAIPLGIGTATGYTAAMLGAACLVLSSAWPLRLLSERPAAPPGVRTVGSPLRDARYLTVAALNGVITMQFGLLTVGMPLWVTRHTHAPAAMVGLLLVINTVVVALCQVRAARLARDVRAAGRTVLVASLLLLLACLLYAAAAHYAAVVAAGVLVLAVLAHSAGEILSEAGGWELAFELADPRNVGAYQGLSQTGFAAGTALAPAVVTSTAIDHATAGWSLLGMAFVAAGAGTLLVARRARKPA